jgi:hypothetical protein
VNDYVQEQQHHKLQDEGFVTGQVQDHLPPPPATSLAKYAPWIRLLSHPRDVSARLHDIIEEQQLLNGQGEKLTVHELFTSSIDVPSSEYQTCTCVSTNRRSMPARCSNSFYFRMCVV